MPQNTCFVDVHLGRGTGIYVVSGMETMSDQSPPSTFVFLPAGQEREVHSFRGGWSLQVLFQPRALTNQLEKIVSPCAKRQQQLSSEAIFHNEDKALIGISQTLLDLWTGSASRPSRDVFEAAKRLIVSRVAFGLAQIVQHQRPATRSTPLRIQTVIDHIEKNLGEALPLEELANLANLSMYHFARVFRARLDQSPHQYIMERRLVFANKLLNQTEIPISQVAYDCGFSSQSHLTVAFRRSYGVTPGHARKASM